VASLLLLINTSHSVIKKTANPKWNDTLTLECSTPPSQSLIMSVYNFNRLKGHVLLGEATINVTDIHTPNDKKELTVDLQKYVFRSELPTQSCSYIDTLRSVLQGFWMHSNCHHLHEPKERRSCPQGWVLR
jgi:hypothetical protein